ncbi:MAG: ABC transporter substrate-binding protein [Burkholderiales bacterium]
MKKREFIRALAALGAGAGTTGLLAQGGSRRWRVGYLSPQSRADAIQAQSSTAFVGGLRDLGYVEGRNLDIEWRFADGDATRLPEMARDLVRLRVDVIVALASQAIRAAQDATTTIPIVMATTGDPVGSGFVKSLAHPGGNITGLSNMGGELVPKLLDLLRSVLPRVSRVAVLVSPTSSTSRAMAEGAANAARQVGMKVINVGASSPLEIEAAFATATREGAEAILVGEATFLTSQRQQIAKLALRDRLPSVSGNHLLVEAGCLMSYGTKFTENFVRSASYVDKILKGAKPRDLPVEQSTTLELAVNLKTANALRVAIPGSILLRADQVIE